MKTIKHKWIKLLGRRVHTSSIICYVVKQTTIKEDATNHLEYFWKVVVYFEKEIFDRDGSNSHVIDYYCPNKEDAEKFAKKLDKIFKPE